MGKIAPRFIFLCGIAGSMNPELIPLGDVVVAAGVDWWNLNKLSEVAEPLSIAIGDRFFRKKIVPGAPPSNRWNKRLAVFAAEKGKSLPSNDDLELLKMKSRISTSYRPRQNETHYGTIISWEYVL